MRYWDSSALVALIVAEETSATREALIKNDSSIATWWLSKAECASALNRLARERALQEEELSTALADLDTLSATWTEVQPTETVRARAIRLLRIHPLRAADAMQLAAALVVANESPASLPIVSSDERLAKAARREGFSVM